MSQQRKDQESITITTRPDGKVDVAITDKRLVQKILGLQRQLKEAGEDHDVESILTMALDQLIADAWSKVPDTKH